MADQPTIVIANLDSKQLEDSINSILKTVEEKTNEMAGYFDTAVNKINTKLKEIGSAASGGAENSSKQVAEKKATQELREKKMTLDQMQQTEQKVVDSASKYTDEIKKQAQIIRESEQWKTKGYYTYVDEKSGASMVINANKRLSIEEQLLDRQNVVARLIEVQKENEAALRAETQAETQAVKERIAYEERSNQLEMEKLGLAKDLTQEESKRKYASPTSKLLSNEPAWWITQKKLGLTDKETFNAGAANSIEKMTTSLKNFEAAYSKLTEEERKSQFGVTLRENIQRLRYEINTARKEMSRPIDFNSVNQIQVKTLDDMIYKMQKLKEYRQGIDLTKPDAASKIKQVDEAIGRLEKDMDKYMVKGKQVSEMNNVLGRSWAYMKNRLAFYFTVGASTQFIKQLIEVRSQYEMNEKALGILIDSAERGSQIFKELSDMALVSPYTLIELSNAARQLTAYDIAAKDVVDTTRRLADMTAAVGIPIERLTYALGQIKAYGYLNARDARMFSNAGIPLVKQLAEYYTELEGRLVSTADVYDRIKKKTIDYNDVMSVVNHMTDEGGKFFNYQAKMAETLKVQLANLTLAWNNMLNDIGESTQGILSGGIKGLKELFLQWRDIEKTIYSVASALATVKIAQIAYLIGAKDVRQSLAMQAVLGKKASTAFNGLGASLKRLATSPWTWVTVGIVMITEFIATAHQAEESVKNLNKSIVDAANERLENINKTMTELQNLYTFEEVEPGIKSVVGINEEDAKKAWEMIREEIENVSSSSKEFILELEAIPDVNRRVAKSFDYLKQIQKAQGALSQLDVKDIKVEQAMSGLWNFYRLQDGIVENFRDMQKEAGYVEKSWSDLGKSAAQGFAWVGGLGALIGLVAGNAGNGQESALSRYQKDLQTTVDSIVSTMKKFNVEGNIAQQEFFSTALEKSLQSTDLTEKEKLKIRIDAQEMFYRQEVERRQKEIERETGDYKKAKQQELNDFIASHQQRNAYVTGFEDWLQKTQISNLQETFAKMTDEEIKHLDFSKGEWKKWAEDNAKKFSEQNNLAIDDVFANLRAYLSQDFVVYIRTVLQKPEISDVQKDFMSRTGFLPTSSQYNEYAKDAKTQVDVINNLKTAQKKKEEEVAAAEKAGGEYAEKNLETLKKTNEELIKMIHSYGARTDAEEKAEKGKNKSGSKKDPVLDALKEEIRLVEKLQGDYDKLTKSGASQEDALTTIRNAYGNTVKQLNAQLGAHGLPALTTQLITGKNPHKALQYFQDTLNNLVSRGMMTLERSKELEGVIEKFTLSAKTYDLEKITKGLNNELDKLKDEYELALELDANPEMGSLFMELFDIDPNELPQNLDQYAYRVLNALNRSLKEYGEKLQLSSIFLTRDDMKMFEEMTLNGELGTKSFDAIKKAYEDIKKRREDNAKDTLKKTQDLQYKLADVNGKIAIEEEKLQNLILKGYRATTEEERRLIDLQVQEQRNVIAKLGEEVVQMLPTYKALFGSIAEHSAGVTRRIAKQWKDALNAATKNSDGSYTITDPRSGQTAPLSRKEYGNQIDKVNGKLRETQSVYKKLKEAFTKGEDEEVDVAKGLEFIGEEAKKAADGLRTVAEIVSALGVSENDVENINDIATTIEGLGTAAQGYAKIQSGDIIGGATEMIKGTWSAVSTWFDNSDKKISSEIARSEREVKKLELAYIDLEHAVEVAYGMETIGAKRVAAANKELQLAELKRQLTLEQSRKKKNQDQDRIIELQKSIRELEYEIKGMTDEIVNDLLGISSVGDAMNSLMDSFVEALREGEDAMEVFDDSIDNMIANMVKKMFTTKILAPWFEEQWNTIQKELEQRAGVLPENISKLTSQVDAAKRVDYSNRDSVWNALAAMGVTGQQIHDYETFDEAGNVIRDSAERFERRKKLYAQMLEQKEKELDAAQREYTQVTTPTQNDIKRYAELLRSGQPIMEENMKGVEDFLRELGLLKDSKDKTLSNLQQGIQGITEDTAGALEAYMNGVSQQCYLQSDLLTQIRDAVVAIDTDVQAGVQAQMLFELQQQYQVQMAIQAVLVGWSNPSGQAVRVEMI